MFCLCILVAGKVQGQDFLDSTKLKPITGLNEILLQSSDMVVAEDLIFFQDVKTDFLIQVYDLNTGKKAYKFGRRGRGPGEYQSISILRGPEPGLIEVSDTKNRKSDIYDISCLKKKPPVTSVHKCIIKTVPNLASRQALILKENLVLNHGSTPQGVLFLSRGNTRLNHIDEIPQDIKNKYQRPIHQAMSTSGFLAASSERTHLAYFADSFDRALFYQRSGEEIELINEYDYSFLPEFEVKDFGGSSMLTSAENHRTAFIHPVAGKSHYFVLYSGKNAEDVKKEGAMGKSFTNLVKVFDWQGNEVHEILLDKNISILSVSYDESILYGMTFNEDFMATVFKANIK